MVQCPLLGTPPEPLASSSKSDAETKSLPSDPHSSAADPSDHARLGGGKNRQGILGTREKGISQVVIRDGAEVGEGVSQASAQI